MKLSAKNRQILRECCADIKRGHAFILADETAIMRKHRLASCDFFKSDFPDYAGEKWGKIEKRIGNEFVIALGACDRLERLLADEIPSV